MAKPTPIITFPPATDIEGGTTTLSGTAGNPYSLVVCGQASGRKNNKVNAATLTQTGAHPVITNGIVRKEPPNWAVLFPIASVVDTTYTIQITFTQDAPPATGTFQFAARASAKGKAETERLDPGSGATVDGRGFSVSFDNTAGYACAADIHQVGGPSYSGTLISSGPPTAVFSFQGIPAGGDYIITGYVYSMPPQTSTSTGITVTYPMGP